MIIISFFHNHVSSLYITIYHRCISPIYQKWNLFDKTKFILIDCLTYESLIKRKREDWRILFSLLGFVSKLSNISVWRRRPFEFWKAREIEQVPAKKLIEIGIWNWNWNWNCNWNWNWNWNCNWNCNPDMRLMFDNFK